MASYKDLMKLMRKGLSAGEIMERLKLTPSRLRQILAVKRLSATLEAEEYLARQIVRHQLASGVQTAAIKMRELIEGEQTETMRKACLTLLTEGLSAADGNIAAADKSDEADAATLPADALDAAQDGQEG